MAVSRDGVKKTFLGVVRMLSLVLLASLGTVTLVHQAPGYFTDASETDARYAAVARARLEAQHKEESSLLKMFRTSLERWAEGDLGRSREFDVPVSTLLAQRCAVSAKLLLSAVAGGWLCSLTLALPLAARRSRRGEAAIAAPLAVLLAIPTGALATLCLLFDFGGPTLVLATVIAVRDFKLIYKLLRQSWSDPCILHARAFGLSTRRLMLVHVLPRLRSRAYALLSTSFILALSALVPVEVIFNTPGLGQLAFSAAMNRDLPVLVAVTMVMALCVGVASLATSSTPSAELA